MKWRRRGVESVLVSLAEEPAVTLQSVMMAQCFRSAASVL